MFGKKTTTDSYSADYAKLLEYMKAASEGKFDLADASEFTHPEAAEAYNGMIDSFLKANNKYVMRMNRSMTRIGDSSVVRTMLEEVIKQSGSVQTMRESGSELSDSVSNIQSFAKSIREKAGAVSAASGACTNDMTGSIGLISSSAGQMSEVGQQVESFREQVDQINSIIDTVKDLADNSSLLALNASIEAARAGESGKGFAVVAQQMGQLSNQTTACADDVVGYVEKLKAGMDSLQDSVKKTADRLKEGNESVTRSVESLKSMDSQVDSIGKDIDAIYNEIRNQSDLTNAFVGIGNAMATSYDALYNECMDTGRFLYKISRDVDGNRSDMARGLSKLEVQDWLTVFKVDHLIFTWRLYNMIVGFETLRIEQLNNPDGCKLGKWLCAQKDSKITGVEAFGRVKGLHKELHDHACDCFYANERKDRDEAMRHFNLAYATYEKLMPALDDLKNQTRAAGYKAETIIE